MKQAPAIHPERAFDIIFEDEYLVVINKKAKLLVQPSPKQEAITITSLLSAALKKPVFACHRLDRETTGLLIYAKNRAIQNKLMQQFKAGAVEKRYFAFIIGILVKKTGILQGVIIDREGRFFGEREKYAKTAYRVIQEFPAWSFLELKPFTGRTNQLRIQLAKENHPILGERKYAFGKDFSVKFRRLALHAYFLNFRHPVSKEKFQFEIPLARDMEVFLEKKP
jgi:RluA family pseudouridine synthase